MQGTGEHSHKSWKVSKVNSPSYSSIELSSSKELSEVVCNKSKCTASSPLLEIKLTPTDEQHVSEGETHTFDVPHRHESTSSRVANNISVSNCNTNGSYSVNEWNEVHQHGTFLSKVNSHPTVGNANKSCEPNSAVTTVPELIHSSSRINNNHNATNVSFSSPTSYQSVHSADNELVQDYNMNNNVQEQQQQLSPQPPSHRHHNYQNINSHNTFHQQLQQSSSHHPSLHTHQMYNSQVASPATRLSLSENSLSSLPEASSPSSSLFSCFSVSSPMQTRHTHSANDVSMMQMASFRSRSEVQLSERSRPNYDTPCYPPTPPTQSDQVQYNPEEHQTPLSDRNSTSKSSTSFSHNPYAYIPLIDSNEEKEQNVNEYNVNNVNMYNTSETGNIMSFSEQYQNANLYSTSVNQYSMPSSSVPLPPPPIGTVNSNTTMNAMADSYIGYQNNTNNINNNNNSNINIQVINNYTQYMPSNINTTNTNYNYNKNNVSNNIYNNHKSNFNSNSVNNSNNNNNSNKKSKFYNSTAVNSTLISPCPVSTTPDTPITPFIQFCEVANSRGNSEGERTPMANFKLGHGATMMINMREVALQLIQKFANIEYERKVLHCLQNMELKYKVITLTWWLRIIITDTSHRSDLERIPHLINSLIFRCNSLSPAQLLLAIIEWLRFDVERREYISCTRLFYNLAILITCVQNFADVDQTEMLIDYLHNHNEPEQVLLLPPSVMPIQSKKSTELMEQTKDNNNNNNNNNNSDKTNSMQRESPKCDVSSEEISIKANVAFEHDKCVTKSKENDKGNNEATIRTAKRDKETELERTRRVQKHKRLVYNFYSGSLYKPCCELIPIGICNVALQALVREREFTQGVTFVKTVLPNMNELLHKSPVISNATSSSCALEQLLRITLLSRFRVLHYLAQMSNANNLSVSPSNTVESLSLSFTPSTRPNSELAKTENELKESECKTHDVSNNNNNNNNSNNNGVSHNALTDEQNEQTSMQSEGSHTGINKANNTNNKSMSSTCHKDELANSFIRQCFEVPKVREDVEIAFYHTLCQRDEEIVLLKKQQVEIEDEHLTEKVNTKENLKEPSTFTANNSMTVNSTKSASELRQQKNNNNNNNSKMNSIKQVWKNNIIGCVNSFNYHDKPVLHALHIMKATSALLMYSHRALFSPEPSRTTSTTILDKCNVNNSNAECDNKEVHVDDTTEIVSVKRATENNDGSSVEKITSAKSEKSADKLTLDLEQNVLYNDTAFTESEEDEIFAAVLKRNKGPYSVLMQAAMVLELLLFCSAVTSKKRHVPRESRVHLFQQIVER